MTTLQSNTWIDNFWLPLLVAIVIAIGGYIISKMRKKIKISINYDESYWTTFEGDNYIVLNLTIINNNSIDLNTLTFTATPAHQLTDNIWSAPSASRDGSSTIIMGAMTQVQNSLGDNPISIRAHDRITGNLVFESTTPSCSITKLTATYQDKSILIRVSGNQIRQRNKNQDDLGN